ncbi:hypothetical protein J7L48_00930 [bacterium]|nr:hypothetical protein [bacterium]
MDISRLRKEVYLLDSERKELQDRSVKPHNIIRGSLYTIYRKCGNPNCKCARGEKHAGKYISISKNGKTHLTYVRKKDLKRVEKGTRNYKAYQNNLARIREINEKIYTILEAIRDERVKEYK